MTFGSRLQSAEDFPASVPVFPLTAALLLPRGTMPLNIFEPRYLTMVDDALRSERLIGMIQPQAAVTTGSAPESPAGKTDLCTVGCLGRITGFQESDDDRYLITLRGVCRFRIENEIDAVTPYRQYRIDVRAFTNDLCACSGEDAVDRNRLLETFRAYLDANDMEADWPSVLQANTEALVNALSMMSPYGPREKQALLEAVDLKSRADMLIAMTEMTLHETGGPSSEHLQ